MFLHARRGTRAHKRREPTGGDDAEQSDPTDPADPAEMHGSIESDGHATERLRADRDAERRARDGDTATQPREIRGSAGNWPGLAEAIRTRRAACSPTQLAVATAPVEDTAGHVVPIGETFELTHAVQGTAEDAREVFAARCQRQGFEILEAPTAEEITLADLLDRVNDPDSSLDSI